MLGTGFCQLHFAAAAPEQLRAADAARPADERLPPEVVEAMAARMEAPEPGKYPWERFSFSVMTFDKEGRRVEVSLSRS